MRDPELIRLFQTLDIGVEAADPEPAFAEDLYRRLRTEARRSRPGRAVLLAIAALLVTGLLGVALVLGSGILPAPAPSESPSSSAEAAASQSAAPSARWVATGDPVNDWRRLGWGLTVTLLADGRVLMVGEVSAPGVSAGPATELYIPGTGSGTTGTWEATPSTIRQARDFHTATLLADGRVLVVGGVATADLPPMTTETILDSAEIYEPTTGQWSATASMRIPRRDHTATLLADGRVLVAGGAVVSRTFTCGDPLDPSRLCPVYVSTDSAEIYDPRTGRWSTIEPMPYGLENHTATRLNDGPVLVVGGTSTDDPFLFDPISESWTPTEPFPVSGRVGLGPWIARNNHTATLLQDGRVLVAGGGWPESAYAEIYDPTTGRWSATGSMAERRFGFIAALLPDGRVLAAGSGNGGYGGSSTAELYDPDTGSWTPAHDLLRRRGFHEGTRLVDGRVLIVAGFGNPLDQTQGIGAGGSAPWAEVYEPGGY